MLENYRVAARLVASRVVLGSTELVIGPMSVSNPQYTSNQYNAFLIDTMTLTEPLKHAIFVKALLYRM
jgi:hypothetical protein